jgi:hypothetical protein
VHVADHRGDPHDHRWLTPREAVRLRARGEIELPPPTFVTLCVLERFASVSAACEGLALAHKQYVPKLCATAGGLVHLYDGDAGYEAGDPERPGQRHRLLTVGEDWRYEDTRPRRD